MSDKRAEGRPMARWGDADVPPVGTYWRDARDEAIYEVIGHDVHSEFNVVLRPWQPLRYEAADRFKPGTEFHHYEDVTRRLLEEFAVLPPPTP